MVGAPTEYVPPILPASFVDALLITDVLAMVLVASLTAVGQLFKLIEIVAKLLQPSKLKQFTV